VNTVADFRDLFCYYICMKKQVVVIAGPSGSGETTFTEELMLAYPHFTRAVSVTTRPPREGERDGEDYYFVTKERFFDEVRNGNIPEHTYVANRDAYYGSFLPELEKKIASGKTVIVNTDLNGALFYKERYHATTIFLKPMSVQLLHDRLVRRDPDMSKDDLIARLINATQEMFDAERSYDYVVLTGEGGFADTILKMIDLLRREGYAV